MERAAKAEEQLAEARRRADTAEEGVAGLVEAQQRASKAEGELAAARVAAAKAEEELATARLQRVQSGGGCVEGAEPGLDGSTRQAIAVEFLPHPPTFHAWGCLVCKPCVAYSAESCCYASVECCKATFAALTACAAACTAALSSAAAPVEPEAAGTTGGGTDPAPGTAGTAGTAGGQAPAPRSMPAVAEDGT